MKNLTQNECWGLFKKICTSLYANFRYVLWKVSNFALIFYVMSRQSLRPSTGRIGWDFFFVLHKKSRQSLWTNFFSSILNLFHKKYLHFIWSMESVIFKRTHCFGNDHYIQYYINFGGLGTPLNKQTLWFYLTRWIIYDQNNDQDSSLHALHDFWHIDTP